MAISYYLKRLWLTVGLLNQLNDAERARPFLSVHMQDNKVSYLK